MKNSTVILLGSVCAVLLFAAQGAFSSEKNNIVAGSEISQVSVSKEKSCKIVARGKCTSCHSTQPTTS